MREKRDVRRGGVLNIIEFILIAFLFSYGLVSSGSFIDNSLSNFSLGTYNNTEYNITGFIQLTPNDTLQELPNNQRDELASGLWGGINMTGNVLLMHFNNDSGVGESSASNFTYDYSGNGNSGNCTGMGTGCNWTTGKLNKGIVFDGTDDDVQINNNSLGSYLTIGAWFKVDVDANNKAIIAKSLGDSATYSYLIVYHGANNAIYVVLNGGSPAWLVTSYTLGDISGQWHYVMFTFNTTDFSLYFDGVNQDHNTGSAVNVTYSGVYKTIIGDFEHGSPSHNFDGTIDEVSIWNRSLSDLEISEIYNRQKGNFISKGTFTSRIFNAGSSSRWNNISWTQGGYYQQELPNNQANEITSNTSPNGNINMTGNVLLYHFNNDSNMGEDSSSNFTYDYSGNGNSGNCTGMGVGCTWTSSGKINGALNFDGVNDFVNAGNSSTLDLVNNFTWELWIKLVQYDVNDVLMNKRRNNAGSGSHQFQIVTTTGNVFRFLVYKSGTNYDAYSTTPVSTGVWYYLVGTYDGANVKIYLNGNLEGTQALTGNLDSTLSEPLQIGKWYSATTHWINGTIDEVAVFNRSLSASEVLDHYKRGILRLNLSVQSCNDAFCNGETWTNLGSNLTSPQNLNVANNTFFQYKFDFLDSANANYTVTPELYNVTINYDILDNIPPSITLNSPTNNTNTSLTNINFNFTAIDETATTFNCSLYVDNVYRNNNGTTLNGTLTNLNVSSLTEGNHTWFVNCTDGSQNQNKSEVRNFYIDLTPPNITNVIYSPNSTDDVDPGTNVTINATVADNRVQVSSVILQYYNGSIWANITMSTSGNNNYNATITTVSSEQNYAFNIWANDSLGNSNHSVNQTFSSVWDCTWNATSDLGSANGWDENKWIGNITINNTGDAAYSNNNCSLDFRLTYDLAEGRIYYDGEYLKNFKSYSIPAKLNHTIIINATFGTEIKQENLIITLEEVRLRSSFRYRNTTSTLLSNLAGPYLYQAITSYPANVYLTAGDITLNGYLRNLMGGAIVNENNTAYNVSFYWTLPSGLAISSGNSQIDYENVTNSSLNYNNLILTFSNLASMLPGTKTASLKSYGYNLSGDFIKDSENNTVLINEINITFLCYNATDGTCVTACGYTQDSDCSAPAGSVTTIGSSSGGGGGPEGSRKLEVSEANFELLNGQEQEFKLPIRNKMPFAKENVRISVSGINSEYISITPKEITRIEPYSSFDITVRITAPAYFTTGQYKLTFAIDGEMIANKTNEIFSEKKFVTLYIVEVSRQESDNMINDSIRMIAEMNSSNMSLKDVSELLNSMKSYYDKIDFSSIRDSYKTIKEIYSSAFKALEIIIDLKEKISSSEKAGVGVIETKKILYIAESAFNRGDFIVALKNLEQAKLTYALETKGEFNLLFTVKNHPLQTFYALIGLMAFSFGSSIAIRFRLYKRKLKYLSVEEKLLLELMKSVQRQCFESNNMSMEEYRQAISQYEQKLGDAIEQKINVESKMSNLLKIKGKRKALDREKERLVQLMKELQDDYLNKGKIETRVYQNMLNTYSRRLSEIEEKITFIEANEALKANKLLGRILRIFRHRK